MRLFLDTSVLLAASGSGKGASRYLITEASGHGWELVSSDYCDEETHRNLPKVGRSAAIAWRNDIKPRLRFVRADLILDKPLVYPKANRHAGRVFVGAAYSRHDLETGPYWKTVEVTTAASLNDVTRG